MKCGDANLSETTLTDCPKEDFGDRIQQIQTKDTLEHKEQDSLAHKAFEFFELTRNEKTNCVFHQDGRIMVLLDLPSVNNVSDCTSGSSSIFMDNLNVLNVGNLPTSKNTFFHSAEENLVGNYLDETKGNNRKYVINKSEESEELARKSLELFGLIKDRNTNRVFHKDRRLTILVDLTPQYSNVVEGGSLSQKQKDFYNSSDCSVVTDMSKPGSGEKSSQVLGSESSSFNLNTKCNDNKTTAIESSLCQQKPFACDFCERRYFSRNALKVHMRTHTGQRSYKCSMCDKAFYQKCELQAHIRKTHLCYKRFREIHFLAKHIDRVHAKSSNEILSYNCPTEQCSSSSSGDVCLQDIQMLSDCNIINKSVKVNRVGPVDSALSEKSPESSMLKSCVRDGEILEAYSSGYNNRIMVNGENAMISDLTPTFVVPETVRTDGETFNCQIESLNQNVLPNQKPYPCERCGRGYYSKNALKLHVRTHTEQKEFLCHLCAKAFYHNCELQKHFLKIHLKEKAFQCFVCFKRFHDKYQLCRHMKVHKLAD